MVPGKLGQNVHYFVRLPITKRKSTLPLRALADKIHAVRQYHNGRLFDKPQAAIWREAEQKRRCEVNAVCQRLLTSFGKPRLGNPREPVDDLVFLMLSNRTQFETARLVFNSLKRMGWDAVVLLPLKTLERRI